MTCILITVFSMLMLCSAAMSIITGYVQFVRKNSKHQITLGWIGSIPFLLVFIACSQSEWVIQNSWCFNDFSLLARAGIIFASTFVGYLGYRLAKAFILLVRPSFRTLGL